jgi:hypothetical protein
MLMSSRVSSLFCRFGLGLALMSSGWAFAACPPAGAGEQVVFELVECLGNPDPKLRDEVGFGGLQKMLRGGKTDAATLQALRVRLLAILAEPADAAGFRQPFAALALSEVARVDRLQPFLSAGEREQLVQAAARYLAGVRDYRGFDEREGWRHGVAHGADLMLQLSLNPRLDRPLAEAMLAAIAQQVVPAGDHFYRYGESERLMAPVFYLARRGWLTAEDWERWFAPSLARLPKGGAQTQAGLAARHNLGAFVSALYLSVRESGNAEVEQAMLPALKKAAKALD